MSKKIVEIDGHEVRVQQEQVAKFQNDVEKIVAESGLTYLEAIAEYCELNNIEMDTIKNLLSPSLYRKVTREAKDLNLVNDGSGRLPI